MGRKIVKEVRSSKPSTETNHVLWIPLGIAVSLVWTAAGCLIAAIKGDSVRGFLREWINYQGPFLLALGTWMLLIIRSNTFQARVRALTEEKVTIGALGKWPLKVTIVAFVTVVGSITVSRMGFNGNGAVLIFMWFTNLCIDFASGIVTLHALTIVWVVHHLQYHRIKVSRYAPARTRELRNIVKYFSTFTLLMTVGYAFALAGTLNGNWTGSKDYVETIQWFWPIIYVPICCAVLIYPHIAIHKLIQRQKEDTLRSCQEDIDGLLEKYGKLKDEEIGRTNELAQLFDRITATPNYVVDFGIAARTLLPLAFNLLTLFLKVSVTPR